MIITKKLNNDSDNQILEYHKIIDCVISQKTNDVTFIVGSWVSQESENEKPLFKTNIDVHYDKWSSEYYNVGSETVMGHPEWNQTGPIKPDENYIWNPITLDWILPSEAPLDEIKSEKWEEIKHRRNLIEFGGFFWNNYHFQSTQISVIRIGVQVQAAIISKLMETPFSVDWTLEDNSIITLASNDMIGVSIELIKHVNLCHNKGKLLRSQIDSAKSSLQVSKINW